MEQHIDIPKQKKTKMKCREKFLSLFSTLILPISYNTLFHYRKCCNVYEQLSQTLENDSFLSVFFVFFIFCCCFYVLLFHFEYIVVISTKITCNQIYIKYMTWEIFHMRSVKKKKQQNKKRYLQKF